MFEVCACVSMCVHARVCTCVCIHVYSCYIFQKGQLFVVDFNQLTYFWLNVECMQSTVVYVSSNEQGRGTLISCLANYRPGQPVLCGLLSHACVVFVVKVMRQLQVFTMSCGSHCRQ